MSRRSPLKIRDSDPEFSTVATKHGPLEPRVQTFAPNLFRTGKDSSMTNLANFRMSAADSYGKRLHRGEWLGWATVENRKNIYRSVENNRQALPRTLAAAMIIRSSHRLPHHRLRRRALVEGARWPLHRLRWVLGTHIYACRIAP